MNLKNTGLSATSASTVIPNRALVPNTAKPIAVMQQLAKVKEHPLLSAAAGAFGLVALTGGKLPGATLITSAHAQTVQTTPQPPVLVAKPYELSQVAKVGQHVYIVGNLDEPRRKALSRLGGNLNGRFQNVYVVATDTLRSRPDESLNAFRGISREIQEAIGGSAIAQQTSSAGKTNSVTFVIGYGANTIHVALGQVQLDAGVPADIMKSAEVQPVYVHMKAGNVDAAIETAAQIIQQKVASAEGDANTWRYVKLGVGIGMLGLFGIGGVGVARAGARRRRRTLDEAIQVFAAIKNRASSAKLNSLRAAVKELVELSGNTEDPQLKAVLKKLETEGSLLLRVFDALEPQVQAVKKALEANDGAKALDSSRFKVSIPDTPYKNMDVVELVELFEKLAVSLDDGIKAYDATVTDRAQQLDELKALTAALAELEESGSTAKLAASGIDAGWLDNAIEKAKQAEADLKVRAGFDEVSDEISKRVGEVKDLTTVVDASTGLVGKAGVVASSLAALEAKIETLRVRAGAAQLHASFSSVPTREALNGVNDALNVPDLVLAEAALERAQSSQVQLQQLYEKTSSLVENTQGALRNLKVGLRKADEDVARAKQLAGSLGSHGDPAAMEQVARAFETMKTQAADVEAQVSNGQWLQAGKGLQEFESAAAMLERAVSQLDALSNELAAATARNKATLRNMESDLTGLWAVIADEATSKASAEVFEEAVVLLERVKSERTLDPREAAAMLDQVSNVFQGVRSRSSTDRADKRAVRDALKETRAALAEVLDTGRGTGSLDRQLSEVEGELDELAVKLAQPKQDWPELKSLVADVDGRVTKLARALADERNAKAAEEAMSRPVRTVRADRYPPNYTGYVDNSPVLVPVFIPSQSNHSHTVEHHHHHQVSEVSSTPSGGFVQAEEPARVVEPPAQREWGGDNSPAASNDWGSTTTDTSTSWSGE